ncbi:quinone-interacting membrane-bound oxidoreductase complex subunit QmoC [Desulfotignum phosphitoxidans]|jgi:quinone-modifying oxidoreductase subunit QmoC|uniref:Quinone-interacting membrane-bound oxidoreductase complex, subunit QmoC n=1 Tax=Desulfotignum phosphitoxidans DSM 13687 TaxID=1286635 RepID=S0FV49_9BACT|nr:quinone-interacting membrane-bound oxidoreductase complex subunit QmoC [Desulfotignum phosphitoxidans]EMS78585.1 quinone-interacting membrane-bound oxidoreductase complex, subunit QmoC [Desulfotignum phosphitoxidans DSM 13687]
MTETYLAQPDLGFIAQIRGLGGDTLKKCYQCATCSVACPISPENSPFPRKEMIAASWGLKDRLIKNGDIWLCHNCGDCTDLCPRGAAPGDVLAAIRAAAITEYAQPKALAKAVNDPKKLPWLLGIPAIWFAILAYITMAQSDVMTKIFNVFGIAWSHAHEGVIAQANFFSTWFVDLTFVPLATAVVIIFLLSLRRFITDIHENAVMEGKTDKKNIDYKSLVQALVKTVPTILKHEKFNECETNKERATPHMMVLFSFIGLFIVTGIFFFVLYVFQTPGPYSQLNPVKWLGNIAGVALVIGSGLMIKSRLDNKDQVSTYKDWYILGIVFALGVTGMLTQMARLAHLEWTSYILYYLHLIAIFNLFAFLPFSKMAHLVYRTTAMAYAEYSNRK